MTATRDRPTTDPDLDSEREVDLGRYLDALVARWWLPLLGLVVGVILGYLLVKSVIDLADPEASYSGSAVLGVGVPLFIGAAFLILGAILMIVWRFAGTQGYFDRRGFEAVPHELATGRVAPQETL